MTSVRALNGWILAVIAVAAGCTGRYVRPTSDVRVELTPERVERGRYLVEHVAMCGACHDGRASTDILAAPLPQLKLSGGAILEDGPYVIQMPNITPDIETGIGGWTDDELIRGIRDGVRPDGSFMFPIMPFNAYQHISDEDVRAIVAYLRTVPAVRQPAPRQEPRVPFPIKIGVALGAAMHRPVKSVPSVDPGDPVRHGEYLAYLGHCTECHSLGPTGARNEDDRWMAGSDGPFEMKGVGKVWASNLTPSRAGGLGGHSADEIKAALIEGRRLDGRRMAPPMSLFPPYLAGMKPEDLDRLVIYLQSLPSVDHRVPARRLTSRFAELLD